jgi:hypothetical protein
MHAYSRFTIDLTATDSDIKKLTALLAEELDDQDCFEDYDDFDEDFDDDEGDDFEDDFDDEDEYFEDDFDDEDEESYDLDEYYNWVKEHDHYFVAERVGLDLGACRDDEVDYTITF